MKEVWKEGGTKETTGRSSEKRRERSKVAARCRRSMEAEIFMNLGLSLPLPENIRTSLDKASIMRLNICDLKLRRLMDSLLDDTAGSVIDITSGLEYESSISKAIGGFVIIFCGDGDITYVSENITSHLGLAQCDVMGQSIYEFSHPCDHADIKKLLIVNKGEEAIPYRSAFFRFKCTLTSRGRSVHIRSASYKVVNCTGRLFLENKSNSNYNCYVGICEPLPHPSDVDIPLNKQTFLSRHNPDMTCDYIDESVENFLRYKPEDLVGKSIFKFHHAADSYIVGKSYKSLYVKGQIQTERYRFLAKHGGWIWVVTQATVLNASNSLKPNSIVCLHFVTSEIENEEEILSDVQISTEPLVAMVADKNFTNLKVKRAKAKLKKHLAEKNTLPLISEINENFSCPSPSTIKIFSPKTEDMDSGYLLLCDKDNTLTSSKEEEPEDLTHLAPIAGDDCVSLNVHLLDDLLKSFDQSNLHYSVNGFMIDVNADSEENPLLLTPGISETSSVLNENVYEDESFTHLHESPLFLNSDPLMGRGTGGPLQATECNRRGLDSYSDQNTILYQPSSVETGSCSSMESNVSSNYTLSEELMELSKACAGIPGDDLPMFDPATTELVWPDPVKHTKLLSTTYQLSNSNVVSSDVKLKAESVSSRNSDFEENMDGHLFYTDETDNTRKLFRPCIDIEKGDNTKLKMDILSILTERRAGDFPKVVTSLIFGELEPPIKLKRTGFPHSHLKAEDIFNSNCFGEPPSLRPKTTSIVSTSVDSYIQRTNSVQSLLVRCGEYNNSESRSNSIGQFNRYPTQYADWFFRKRNCLGRLMVQDCHPMLSFSELTRQDYEVNAPLEDSRLLQGHDLLSALDTENFNDLVAFNQNWF